METEGIIGLYGDCRVYTGIMEKSMETTRVYRGYRDYTGIIVSIGKGGGWGNIDP